MATRRSYSTAAAPTTLTVGVDNAVTSITVQDGSTYVDGTSGPSVLTIDRGKSNEERILYTSRVGNTFTGLTRGYNGTAAQSHTAGAIVEHTSTQQDFDEANAHLADTTRNDHTQYARVGSVNTFTAAQTFSAAATFNGTATFPGGILGGIAATAADHYFGANAAGGAGTRVHIGSMGDTVSAHVRAEGDVANVSLALRAKGTGAGGASAVHFQDGTGADSAYFSSPNGLATDDTSFVIGRQQGVSFTLQRVTEGAVDSGGAGFRVLRIAN